MFGSSREWQHQVDTVRDGAGRLADSRSSREGVEKQVGCIAAHGRVKHTVMQRQMNDIFHSRTFPPRVCCSSFVVGGAVACSSDRKYRGVFRTFFYDSHPLHRLAEHPTALRAWCQQMSAWSAKSSRSPSRHGRDVKGYGMVVRLRSRATA